MIKKIKTASKKTQTVNQQKTNLYMCVSHTGYFSLENCNLSLLPSFHPSFLPCCISSFLASFLPSLLRPFLPFFLSLSLFILCLLMRFLMHSFFGRASSKPTYRWLLRRHWRKQVRPFPPAPATTAHAQVARGLAPSGGSFGAHLGGSSNHFKHFLQQEHGSLGLPYRSQRSRKDVQLCSSG